MYAEMGLLFPFLQGFPQELHHGHHPLEEELLCRLQSSNGHPLLHNNATSNLVQSTTISDYDLGGEGDLFEAPKPIMEEPVMELDPVSAAISMMSNDEDVIASEAFNVADVDSVQKEPLLIEDFYECKNDLLAKSSIEDVYSDLLDVKFPTLQIDEEKMTHDDRFIGDGSVQKSVSPGCLETPDWINGGGQMKPDFFDIQGMDLGDVFGVRGAYSEGDIKIVGDGHLRHFNGGTVHLPFESLLSISEERRQKLCRYRKKKIKRNFGRKIKYACRKALADIQPRVRGRFAKTEECELAKTYK